MNAVCVHVQMSDNRESLCHDENSWLLVDAVLCNDMSDNREWLCDKKSYFRAYSHDR